MDHFGHLSPSMRGGHRRKQITHHLTHRPPGIIGGGQLLGDPDAVARARVGDTVGEGAADIYRDSKRKRFGHGVTT